jgi:hypothetical protein
MSVSEDVVPQWLGKESFFEASDESDEEHSANQNALVQGTSYQNRRVRLQQVHRRVTAQSRRRDRALILARDALSVKKVLCTKDSIYAIQSPNSKSKTRRVFAKSGRNLRSSRQFARQSSDSGIGPVHLRNGIAFDRTHSRTRRILARQVCAKQQDEQSSVLPSVPAGAGAGAGAGAATAAATTATTASAATATATAAGGAAAAAATTTSAATAATTATAATAATTAATATAPSLAATTDAVPAPAATATVDTSESVQKKKKRKKKRRKLNVAKITKHIKAHGGSCIPIEDALHHGILQHMHAGSQIPPSILLQMQLRTKTKPISISLYQRRRVSHMNSSVSVSQKPVGLLCDGNLPALDSILQSTQALNSHNDDTVKEADTVVEHVDSKEVVAENNVQQLPARDDLVKLYRIVPTSLFSPQVHYKPNPGHTLPSSQPVCIEDLTEPSKQQIDDAELGTLPTRLPNFSRVAFHGEHILQTLSNDEDSGSIIHPATPATPEVDTVAAASAGASVVAGTAVSVSEAGTATGTAAVAEAAVVSLTDHPVAQTMTGGARMKGDVNAVLRQSNARLFAASLMHLTPQRVCDRFEQKARRVMSKTDAIAMALAIQTNPTEHTIPDMTSSDTQLAVSDEQGCSQDSMTLTSDRMDET